MRKTDKKTDNLLIKVLTDVCENELKKFSGFQWLTHTVNYSNFPKSLKVICIFDNHPNLENFLTSHDRNRVSTLIQTNLFKINIDINRSHISYDIENNYNKKQTIN